MVDSSLWHENVTPASDLDFVNVYNGFPDLPVQPCLEPADGIVMSGTTDFRNMSLPVAAEFVDEHYVELSDVGFAGERNPMELFDPGDCLYPFANVPGSFGQHFC